MSFYSQKFNQTQSKQMKITINFVSVLIAHMKEISINHHIHFLTLLWDQCIDNNSHKTQIKRTQLKSYKNNFNKNSIPKISIKNSLQYIQKIKCLFKQSTMSKWENQLSGKRLNH